MKGTETGKDKVKKICDILRKETLEPAKHDAEEIIQKAERQAHEIVAAAGEEASRILEEARQEIERQRNVFRSSIDQACKQAMIALRQNIEEKFFNQELGKLISKQTQEPKVLAQLITAVVKGLEKEGAKTDLSVYIPAAVPAREVNTLLAQEILEKLKEKSVLVGPLAGGIEVKLHKGNITLDISDAALKELLANYIRKDFRGMIFGLSQ